LASLALFQHHSLTLPARSNAPYRFIAPLEPTFATPRPWKLLRGATTPLRR